MPSAGGIYDQHPQFLDAIEVIFKAEKEFQDKEDKRKEKEAGRKSK